MPDVFLYTGEPNPNDVVLSDPTTIRGGTVAVSVSDAGAAIESVPDVLASISSSDLGAGAESTPDILASISSSDLGAGTESVPGVLALVPTSDVGSGTETVGILALVSTSDVGSGSESEGILALVPASDSGVGVESTAALALVPTSDTGSGLESVPGILALVGGSDTGAGSESTPGVLATIPTSDAGAGVEAAPGLLAQVPVPDIGSGMESALFIEDNLTIFEVGTGSESLGVLAQVSISDLGSGAEEAGVLAEVPVSDSGHGDPSYQSLVLVSVSDSGSGSEDLSVIKISPPSGGFGGLGGGGGGFSHHEAGMLRGLSKPKLKSTLSMKSFVEKVSADVATLTMEGLKKSTHADPLKVAREIPEEKVREGVIRTLRARITELEAQIRKLKGAHGVTLAGALAELEHAQMLAGAVLERALAAEGKLAQLRPIEVHVTLAAPPEETSGWAVLLGAAAVWLATETLVPPREKALKEAGRGVAGLLALYGVAKVL
jgi:hypothetical protein